MLRAETRTQFLPQRPDRTCTSPLLSGLQSRNESRGAGRIGQADTHPELESRLGRDRGPRRGPVGQSPGSRRSGRSRCGCQGAKALVTLTAG